LLLGNLLKLTLDHCDAVHRSTYHEVEIRGTNFRHHWVDNILASDATYAHHGAWRLERDVGNGDGNRIGHSSQHVGVVLGVRRYYLANNLRLVVVPIREQRTDGAVDETAR